jgi:predicted SAM-dependent methyltransferase
MYLRLKNAVKVLIGKADIVHVSNKKQVITKYCPVCFSEIEEFAPLSSSFFKKLHENQHIHPVFLSETINLFEYSCPKCFSSDRDRLYALFIRDKLPIKNDKTCNIVDIAPSKPLSNFIKHIYPLANYRSADLYMSGVDDVVDVKNMDVYSDESVDFLICSHVLEHIDDDIKAMHEIYRVLKFKSQAIIMVPILLNLNEDYENNLAVTPEDRWKYYGQDDHVRIYSKTGFIEKLIRVGFKVKQFTCLDFSIDVFVQMGIHERSVLYVVEKNNYSFNNE